MLIEPKEWDLDSLDDMYVSLDRYCELRRQRKGLDEGDLPEAQFRTTVAMRLGHFQAAKVCWTSKESRNCSVDNVKVPRNNFGND